MASVVSAKVVYHDPVIDGNFLFQVSEGEFEVADGFDCIDLKSFLSSKWRKEGKLALSPTEWEEEKKRIESRTPQQKAIVEANKELLKKLFPEVVPGWKRQSSDMKVNKEGTKLTWRCKDFLFVGDVA